MTAFSESAEQIKPLEAVELQVSGRCEHSRVFFLGKYEALDERQCEVGMSTERTLGTIECDFIF